MNENHRRSLAATFRHIDGLFSEALRALAGDETESPFSDLVPDATPVQKRVVTDEIRSLRGVMETALGRLGVPARGTRISAVKSALTALLFAEVDVEEIVPRRMRGYGEISAEDGLELEDVSSELRALLKRTIGYLAQGAGEDLGARLARLEATTGDVRSLKEIEAAIGRHGLVDLRPALARVVAALEKGGLEVAVFGRVSSGKSSLLNHLVGREVLPVGVTPVTALPTRLCYGDPSRVVVRFAEGAAVRADLADLRDFVSEQENPGNRRHVVEVRVELPEERLRDGVSLVDTPGLGSLVASGSAEARAYLPQADVGIVLTDASAALSPEDLALVDALCRSGARVMVLVSKADLLPPEDRRRVLDYVRRGVASQVGIEVPVAVVSVAGEEAALADRWFESDLLPLLRDRREVKAAVLRRKVGALREEVVRVLRRRLSGATGVAIAGRDPQGARRSLWRARRALERCRTMCDDLGGLVATSLGGIVEKVSTDMARRPEGAASASEVLGRAISEFASEIGGKASASLLEARREVEAALDAMMGPDPNGGEGREEIPEPRGMPALHVAPMARRVNLKDPPLRLLGAGVRARAFRAQLLQTAGAALEETLRLHACRLRDWARHYIEELDRTLEEGPVVRGVAAEGAVATEGRMPDDTRRAIEEDIRRLTG